MFTLPYTKILGKLACRVCSKILGIGSAERSWGDVKHNKIGKRTSLSGDAVKKQATIYGASCVEAADLRRKIVVGSKPYRFWDDEDFDKCLEESSKENKEETQKPDRIFRAFIEDWEVECIKKKDPTHEAKLLKKYGGLELFDIDEDSNARISETELNWSRPSRKGGGYMVTVYDDKWDGDITTAEEHCQSWVINTDLILCIKTFYKKNPNSAIVIVDPEEDTNSKDAEGDSDDSDNDK